MRWNPARSRAMLPALKPWLAMVVLVCFSAGLAGGFGARGGYPKSCGSACGHAAPQKSPCNGGRAPSDPFPGCYACFACCPCCMATNLSIPEEFWIQFTVGRRAADSDWHALERNYPPPLPPPRVEGEHSQAT